ncbi:pantoate--beta-alanine ligase [Afipia carboxidovorans OM5]|uniref:Pantothenate synthetase n=1 Tax=Afipia carboxidovorans (strain ATCC 49405 / DSM 1227 / KCTC 32145 / OM5) TaxID=504832 RepID=B6JF71_AFIC5|nr:pantoate--beta-alanine ligase [Afipia carboxidovorans]ACI92885.1 pantoate--beta-alanine ligase [Afipia carboxidovorans OM5]AEI03374.1 pantoate-beta-alanine ligase PanC [Afipia carboxidovorans OM4]AEI06951.1 pantoate-beta-alanine ligase PanC [Afipia carboxidovorans OM5]BEV44263.1 pantoate--beta-alanine ligase [Afipia carboxidovorans]
MASSSPLVARTLPALQRSLETLRKRHASVALVPTMGALHDGHISLVRLAKRRANKVVVSIFVNPTQFAPHEDYGSYPRTWKTDAAKLATEGVDLIWNPDAALMYPEGFATSIHLEGPATAGLEDRFRPHFFGGVAIVVAKLLAQVRPDVAIFGEKDYQQLKVVTQMTRDLNLGPRIVGAPIMRERDGLAMSSRNLYLSPEQRKAAPALHRSMKQVVRLLRQGEDPAATLKAGAKLITDAGFKLDYLEARHAETLAPLSQIGREPGRLLAAATIGTTRLIDNMKI